MGFHRINSIIGKLTLLKFDNKCTICGANKDLCVHHIIKMKPDDPNYNDTENLTVVCRSCHMSVHRKAEDIITTGNPTGKGGGSKWGRRGKNVPEIKCVFDNCGLLQHAHGLCKKHYERIRRSGKLDLYKH